jgi:hypothetical protein
MALDITGVTTSSKGVVQVCSVRNQASVREVIITASSLYMEKANN